MTGESVRLDACSIGDLRRGAIEIDGPYFVPEVVEDIEIHVSAPWVVFIAGDENDLIPLECSPGHPVTVYR